MGKDLRKIAGRYFDDEGWRDIVFRYVHAGLNQTSKRISLDLGLSHGALMMYLSAHGIRKDSTPVPPEQITDPEEAAGWALDERERRFVEVFDKKERDLFTRQMRKLQQEDYRNERLVELFTESVKGVSLPDIPSVRCHYTREVGLEPHPWLWTRFDAHFGQLVWSQDSWGDDYDTESAYWQLIQSAEWARDQVLNHAHWCGDIHVVGGGDSLHAILSQTESGTRLDKDTRDMKVIRAFLSAKVTEIKIASNIGRHVYVEEIPGNHDHLFATLAREYLWAFFKDDPMVTVSRSLQQICYIVQGETAHVFDHGKGIPKNLATPLAFEKAEHATRAVMGEEFFEIKNIYYYTGHLHTAQSSEHGAHMEIIREPAMVPADDYATRLRFNNRPAFKIRRLYPDGLIAEERRLYSAHLEKK